MSLRDRKLPNDMAGDWTGHSFGDRLSRCVMQLFLFEMISRDEANAIYEKIGDYIMEEEKNG